MMYVVYNSNTRHVTCGWIVRNNYGVTKLQGSAFAETAESSLEPEAKRPPLPSQCNLHGVLDLLKLFLKEILFFFKYF